MKTRVLLWAILFSGPFALGQYHLLQGRTDELQPFALELSWDHLQWQGPDSIRWFASEDERLWLEQQQLGYRIIQADYTRWFAEQSSPSHLRNSCQIGAYPNGSMGGYHTYQEVLDQLDSMYARHPQLISPRYSIGQTHEGRAIWAVKLSDFPHLNERNSEPRVYYDALTHAREPLSMESLIYYLWWLLENYQTDAQAKYLLDHREIFAVPVLNPDGYVYNQQIAPQGGGLWRKNRRPSQTGCVGIDLNRNYTNGWGSGVGASNNPCSDLYEGTAAISEGETQAVQQLTDTLGAATAFSIHSFGPSFLQPLGFQPVAVEFDHYANWSSEFVPSGSRGYGIPADMLNYMASGSTMDYLHTEGTYTWSPEVGRTFWEPADSICKRVEEMLYPMQYLSWIAGSYARLHDVHLQPLPGGDTLALSFRIQNRGLSHMAEQVEVQTRSLHPALKAIDPTATLGTIAPRALRSWTTFPLRYALEQETYTWELPGIELTVFQAGIPTDRDTVYFVGAWQTEVRFQEDFEQGRSLWLSSGTGERWDTTHIDRHGGQASLTDSPIGNMDAGRTTYLTLDSLLTLNGNDSYLLRYASKWSLGIGGTVQVEVATDNQGFTAVNGRLSQGVSTPHWLDHQHWTWETIDLSAFANETIRLRWKLVAPSLYPADGFYLDDISLLSFSGRPLSINSSSLSPAWQLLGADGHWPIRVAWEGKAPPQLTVSYYAVTGQKLLSKALSPQSGTSQWDLPELAYRGNLWIVLQSAGQPLGARWIQLE